MKLAVRPVDVASVGGSCELAFTEELEGQLSAEMKEAVENGVHSSFLQGKWTKLIFSLFQGNTQSTGTSLILVKYFFNYMLYIYYNFPPLIAITPSFRATARLPIAECVYTDAACYHRTWDFTCHGVCLRVSLHAEGKSIIDKL